MTPLRKVYPWDLRDRCFLDGKVILPDEEEAKKKAEIIRVRNAIPGDRRMEAYRCLAGHWHVGHRSRGR